jgi:hypothetical protein
MEEQKQPEAQIIEIPQELILDLDDNMKTVMKDVIKRAFDDEKTTTKMCEFIKSKLLEKEEGKWNVIIGKDFSTIVVHKSRRYGLFKVGELNILIWQSGSTTL